MQNARNQDHAEHVGLLPIQVAIGDSKIARTRCLLASVFLGTHSTASALLVVCSMECEGREVTFVRKCRKTSEKGDGDGAGATVEHTRS